MLKVTLGRQLSGKTEEATAVILRDKHDNVIMVALEIADGSATVSCLGDDNFEKMCAAVGADQVLTVQRVKPEYPYVSGIR